MMFASSFLRWGPLIALLSAGTTLWAEPAEVWVNASWSGSNSGDLVGGHVFGTDAFAALQAGVDTVLSNGLVHVASGVYAGNLLVQGKPVALKSDSGAQNTIIEGTGADFCVEFDPGEGRNAVLDGFTLRNARTSFGALCVSGLARLLNCNIHSNDGGGIGVSYASAIISNCVIIANKGTGIYCGNAGLILENSRVEADYGYGSPNAIDVAFSDHRPFKLSSNFIKGYVQLWAAPSMPQRADILNNVLATNSLLSLTLYENIDVHVRNNTFVSGFGVGVSEGGSRLHFVNNIISQSSQAIASNEPILEFHHNNFWLSGGASTLGTNANISVDPAFVDPLHDDYHLSELSRCLGAGSFSAETAVDGDGHARPSPAGSAPDLGAYESDLAAPTFRLDHYFGVGFGDFQEYVDPRRPGVIDREETVAIDYNFVPPAYRVESKQNGETQATSWYQINDGKLQLKEFSVSGVDITLTDPLTTLQYPPQQGQKYSSTTQAEAEGLIFNMRINVRVLKPQTISVPAGTYNCYRLRTKTILEAVNFKVKRSVTVTTTWFAPNVGILQTKTKKQIMQLTNYFTGDNSSP